MFSSNLFSFYINNLLKCKNGVIKTCLQRGIQFMNKNFIYKETSGTVAKVKLRKFKKHNQLILQPWC